MTYETLKVDRDGDAAIATISLNRPDALNAINAEMARELVEALETLDADSEIRCLVLTGTAKLFSAGLDVGELADLTYPKSFFADVMGGSWPRIAALRTPIIAAVNGNASGAGCELAMMCDIILAGDKAKFRQHEITMGISPGAGGTQRLTRLVGKSKAMELCLTGRALEADEAERFGLVSRVVAADDLLDEARTLARKIAGMPYAATLTIKELVQSAYETTLQAGLLFERRALQSLFATDDQNEGMEAALEKRAPHFKPPNPAE